MHRKSSAVALRGTLEAATRGRLFLPFLCALFGLLPGPALAHPYHTTTAQAEVNREAGTLEVALKVLPEDLERAVERYSGEKVRLELDPDIDEQILAYLEDRFVLSRDGQDLELRWVGKEVSAEAAWLYFEFPLGNAGPEGVVLEQRVFFELETEQLNLVEVRDGDLRTTLSFHRSKPLQSILATTAPEETQ